jgi:HSP20 family protein
MAIARYQPWTAPWASHQELWNEVNKWFDRVASNDAQLQTTGGATADWAPAVDIEEHPERFVLYADVPGVDPASIEVTLENGVLTLSGSREERAEQKDGERTRIERLTGRFFRRFSLPDTVDADSVKATGRNGVLEVVIPKRPASQPRRIAVKA